MTPTPIERFLSGEQRSTGRTAVSDSRELLMDKLDDILDSSIADLVHAESLDLFNAVGQVTNDFEHFIVEHDKEADDAFMHVTTKAVQIMGLVIALYAQVLEKEEARAPDDEEDEDE